MCSHVILRQSTFSSLLMLRGTQEGKDWSIVYVLCHEVTCVAIHKGSGVKTVGWGGHAETKPWTTEPLPCV